MSTEMRTIAGVQLIEQRPTHDTNVEYWLVKFNNRMSELYILPKSYKERLQTLPSLVGFTPYQLMDVDDQIAVLMPGTIQVPVTKMFSKLGATGCIGMAWHIVDILSLLHQSGLAHNLLHSEDIGLNDLGELEIRPALGRFIPTDPDPKATAIATDCWQMRVVIQHLGVSEKIDPLFALLNRGLKEEFARLRLQPATAIRQSISAVLARHPEWESEFVAKMGTEWALNQRNLQESMIIPHRLKTTRPTLSVEAVQDMSDSIDLWGNLFTSSTVDEASSSQALLLEALSGKQPVKVEDQDSRIELTKVGDSLEEVSERLEIDLIGPTSIQIPLQGRESKSKNPGLVSITEVGMHEAEDEFYHGLSAIVEETEDELEIRHRRRRSKSRDTVKATVQSLQTDLQITDYDSKALLETSSDVERLDPTGAADNLGQTSDFDEAISVGETSISSTAEEVPLSTKQVDTSSVTIGDAIVEEDSSSVLADDSLIVEPAMTETSTEVVTTEVTTEPSSVGAIEPIQEVSSMLTEDTPSEVFAPDQHPPTLEETMAEQLVEEALVLETAPPVSSIEHTEIVSDFQAVVEAVVETVAEDTTGLDMVESSDESSEDTRIEVIVEQEDPIVQAPIPIQKEVIVESFVEDLDNEESEDSVAEDSIEEGSEEYLEERETTSPVSILNMPLVSIVEEDEFGNAGMNSNALVEEDSEEVEGASIDFLIEASEPMVYNEPLSTQLEEVFEPEVSRTDSMDSFPVSAKGTGFVADLSPDASAMSVDELDVEEPLADIEFPSIEEVLAQDAAFGGDVDTLFESVEPVLSLPNQHNSKSLAVEHSAEPKWTGATSFDNLSNAEEALGDEKYAHAQAELGDVDAVLGESIRDFSDMERRGSPWGFMLIISIVVIFAIVYLLNPESVATNPADSTAMTEGAEPSQSVVAVSQVTIQTDPPQGRVLIESVNLGTAPVEWDLTEGDLFLMCVDWGSNPVCRRVPRADLSSQTYTFTQRLTP